MTDRVAGYIVVLEKNIREDDAEVITNAIRQLRGVISVVPQISNPELHFAEERIRRDIGNKLLEIVYPKEK